MPRHRASKNAFYRSVYQCANGHSTNLCSLTGPQLYLAILRCYPGLFDEFKVQKILDRWDKFPGIMWGLGFELDYYHSFEVYRKQSNLKLKPPHSKREERRNLLYLLEHADRQIVGNYLFSEWRKYVKCELSYDQFDLDFIFRVMDILESRYIWHVIHAILTAYSTNIAIQFSSGSQRSPFLNFGVGTSGCWGIFYHPALIRTA